MSLELRIFFRGSRVSDYVQWQAAIEQLCLRLSKWEISSKEKAGLIRR
jgi:hypothetical protein